MVRCATLLKAGIDDARVDITADFHSQGSVLRGDAEGFADSMTITVDAVGDSTPEKMREVMRLAHRMCYAEVAMREGLIKNVHLLNGQDIDA